MTMVNAIAAGIAMAIWLIVYPALIGWAVPFSHFMTVYKVYVPNAVQGEPIRISADREIHRDFKGAFSVDIRKQQAGGWSSECPRGLEDIPYRKGAVYPPDLDLDWWVGSPPNAPCTLEPGRYYIITEWTTSPWWAFGGQITRTIESNAFTIAPKP